MSERASCEACGVTRTLKKYEGEMLCSTCADTVDLHGLRGDSQGKLLLQLNSKLDAMSRKTKER